MESPFVTPTNYEAFGKLVMSWATGTDYLKIPGLNPRPPQSLDDFKSQCSAAQVALLDPFPARIKAIQLIEGNEETLVIYLPPKSLIEDSRSMVSSGAPYQGPDFYRKDLFDNAPLKITDAMRVLAERIGDYTIGICGW